MKVLDVHLTNRVSDIMEIVKKINFISEDIKNIEIVSNEKLQVSVSDHTDSNVIMEKIQEIIKDELKSKKQSVIYSNKNDMTFNDITKLNFDMLGGLTISDSNLIKLLKFFDNEFRRMVIENFENYEERMYPTLLPIKEYLKTGYMRNSPQYGFFCEGLKEDISILEHAEKDAFEDNLASDMKYSQYALSPSACFHSYIELENKELDRNLVLTFKQNVFRNEGRFNYKETGRLRDYHVREIVFFGDDEFVKNSRQIILDLTIDFIKKLDLCAEVIVANDPFILPKMQKYKKIQLMEKSKYEVRLYVNKEKSIASASFNLHDDAFTSPFKISGINKKKIVTGCIGYGLERWMIAFLYQYGEDSHNWPSYVQEIIKEII